jgi:hypothetical protein
LPVPLPALPVLAEVSELELPELPEAPMVLPLPVEPLEVEPLEVEGLEVEGLLDEPLADEPEVDGLVVDGLEEEPLAPIEVPLPLVPLLAPGEAVLGELELDEPLVLGEVELPLVLGEAVLPLLEPEAPMVLVDGAVDASWLLLPEALVPAVPLLPDEPELWATAKPPNASAAAAASVVRVILVALMCVYSLINGPLRELVGDAGWGAGWTRDWTGAEPAGVSRERHGL